MPTCSNLWCSNTFAFNEEDRALLQKFDVPESTECADCRHQRRAMFASMLTLHKRTSDMSGKSIISIHPADAPYPVYSIEEWWSDAWDGEQYEREWDPCRPFFEQFKELFDRVPKMANFNEKAENCDYCNGAGSAKNCYYCNRAYRSEEIYYGEAITGYNQFLCDCLRCQKSNNLYECIQCLGCSYSSFLWRCRETRDSHFCTDCNGCHHCLFCYNLRNQEYCIANQKVSKEEYEKVLASTINGSHKAQKKAQEKWLQTHQKMIWVDRLMMNSENCRGDALMNSSESFECYNAANLQQCRYCVDMSPSEPCVSNMDITRGGIAELSYNCTSMGGGNYFMRMCVKCRGSSNLTYCNDCYYCKDCFGCTGLRSKQYCILNKQYNQEEYEELTGKIIERMRETPFSGPGSGPGPEEISDPNSDPNPTMEWGSFFPPHLSPYPYNGSMAQEIYPMTKEEVLARGWKWSDESMPVHAEKEIPAEKLPDNLSDIPDDILNWAIICQQTGRPFKIIEPELQFYRTFQIPIPREHPDVRMRRRHMMLNPYRLFTRACENCGKEMETSFSPERKERVWCEACYLQNMY